MRFVRTPLLIVVLCGAFALTSCGGDDGDDPATSIPGGADPAAVAVIDDWSTRLRGGDVEGAADLFAIPSVAENGPALVRIEDADDARLFNASLPCGARLVRAESQGEFVLATFRLTERPGPGRCGAGSGETAQTAFLIEDGRIAEWRRAGAAAAGGAPAPSASS